MLFEKCLETKFVTRVLALSIELPLLLTIFLKHKKDTKKMKLSRKDFDKGQIESILGKWLKKNYFREIFLIRPNGEILSRTLERSKALLI